MPKSAQVSDLEPIDGHAQVQLIHLAVEASAERETTSPEAASSSSDPLGAAIGVAAADAADTQMLALVPLAPAETVEPTELETENRRLRHRVAELEAMNEGLKKENESHKAEIEHLKTTKLLAEFLKKCEPGGEA